MVVPNSDLPVMWLQFCLTVVGMGGQGSCSLLVSCVKLSTMYKTVVSGE